ncbi:MAG TPA: hypothetical protein VK206_11095, partial [Anaerolineales bacterium]|nr:hypothetical protein [Anaerolineales bacterium]
MSKGTILVLISFLLSGCALIPGTSTEVNSTLSASPQNSAATPEIRTPTQLSAVELPETDQIIFTIPNTEPWPGREGEPRPNWLGWGAETFTVAADGSFWIADTAVDPNRLLHYSPQGELLLAVSLENQVVYAFDLAVTQNSLWVLDISAQQPRIVQLSMDGKLQSSVNIPKEIMTHDGQLVSNGVSNVSLGGEGKLLLDGINGYYEIVVASGEITARPLEALAYYGHTYQTGIYDEATRRLPIYVDGASFETSRDFFVEVPFLGFNPDGSFAIAGHVETAEQQIADQVRYYSASGELLGTARQRPQTFYKDWNHHLAFG